MRPHSPFRHRTAAHQVLGYDSFASFGRDASVPHPFRVDHHPRSSPAYAKTGGLRPESRDAKLADSPLEDLPGGKPLLGRAAVRTDAQKDMAPRAIEVHFAEFGRDRGIRRIILAHSGSAKA